MAKTTVQTATADGVRVDLDTLTYEKRELLDIITANRDQHRANFDQAVQVWQQRALEEADLMVEDIKRGRKVVRQIGLVRPVDYTHEYNRVIRMLEMAQEDRLSISSRDFNKFIMDNWEWTEHFESTTMSYLAE